VERQSERRSHVIANVSQANTETELVFEEEQEKDHRNAAGKMQRPVQIHLLVQGEIDATRLRSAWQKIAEGASVPIESSDKQMETGTGRKHGEACSVARA